MYWRYFGEEISLSSRESYSAKLQQKIHINVKDVGLTPAAVCVIFPDMYERIHISVSDLRSALTKRNVYVDGDAPHYHRWIYILFLV